MSWSFRNVLTGMILVVSHVAISQSTDSSQVIQVSAPTRHQQLSYLMPGLLIASGTALMLDRDADEFFLSNFEVREERNEKFLNFSSHLDDYLQHAPSLTAFSFSVAGLKGRHDLPNQAALFLKSELLMLGVVYSLKYTVGEARPDTGRKNSFPSGHTAQAFTAATFFAKEYGYKSVWITIGSYTVATTVGVFRMLNNRHWISDVLVGAGIGMLSTELVYRTHQNRWRTRTKASSLRIDPFSASGSTGLSLRYTF